MEQALIAGWAVQNTERHLRQSCHIMARLMAEHGLCPLADREFQPFQTLAHSIINQNYPLLNGCQFTYEYQKLRRQNRQSCAVWASYGDLERKEDERGAWRWDTRKAPQ